MLCDDVRLTLRCIWMKGLCDKYSEEPYDLIIIISSIIKPKLQRERKKENNK